MVAFGLVLALLGQHASNTGRLVLTGVVVGQLFTAMTSLVLLGWGDADAARGLTYWLTGSLAAARWPAVALCVGVTVIALVAKRPSHPTSISSSLSVPLPPLRSGCL